jgi:hypothetical protein
MHLFILLVTARYSNMLFLSDTGLKRIFSMNKVFHPCHLDYMNGFRIWSQVVNCLRHKQENLWQVSVLFSISPEA